MEERKQKVVNKLLEAIYSGNGKLGVQSNFNFFDYSPYPVVSLVRKCFQEQSFEDLVVLDYSKNYLKIR